MIVMAMIVMAMIVMAMIVMAMIVMAMIVVAVVACLHAIGRMVRVAMECPFEQEHQEKPRQDPGHRGVDLPTELEEGMWQEMEQSDAEQHASCQREQHLHPAVPHGKKRQRRPTGVGRTGHHGQLHGQGQERHVARGCRSQERLHEGGSVGMGKPTMIMRRRPQGKRPSSSRYRR